MEINYRDLSSFSIFFSTSNTQILLKDCYKNNNFTNSEQKSFENSYRFIYFIKQGISYYKQAKNAPMSIKATLLFYGLVNIIKACMLVVQPNYPESTKMLAHGVSARKRKKQQYTFLNDEIKCQKYGLFPIMVKEMFNLKYIEGLKFTMDQLFANIPELSELFHYFNKGETFIKVQQTNKSTYLLNKTIVDNYYMTENRFIKFLNDKSSFPHTVENNFIEKYFNINAENLNTNNCLPFKYNLKDNNFYFPLQNDQLIFYPEIIIHYLLLYNLSMVARYETEWWYELISLMPNDDYPFIESFLHVTTEKSPLLLFNYIISKVNIIKI